jgi:hypothetical protein
MSSGVQTSVVDGVGFCRVVLLGETRGVPVHAAVPESRSTGSSTNFARSFCRADQTVTRCGS